MFSKPAIILSTVTRVPTLQSYGGTGCTSRGYASTSSTTPRYPFPKHPRPTPYEIFHISPGASQREIKSRYYDLVRTYHPDSPHCRDLPPAVCHARFQAITAAHEALTGKSTTTFGRHGTHRPHSATSSSSRHWHRDDDPADRAYAEFMARNRARWSRSSEPHMNGFANAEWSTQADAAEAGADDRWKDRVIMAVMIGTLAVAVSPFMSLIPYTSFASPGTDSKHLNAAKNLAQARKDAREYGLERRREIRKRVRINELISEHDLKEDTDEDYREDKEVS